MTGTQRFVKTKEEGWTRLEALLHQVSARGLKSLNEEELLELARRYRQTTSDLAHAQAFVRDAKVLRYLNGLVGRAHGVVYRTKAPGLRGAWEFIATGYPRLVRRHLKFVIAAAILLFGSGFFGFAVVKWDFNARAAVLPAQMAQVETSLQDKERWADIEPDTAPFVSSLILVNNIRVAFMAFAFGIFAGVGSVIVLLFNGVTLGAVFGLAEHHGVLPLLLAFVVSHGVIELTCICIAGGAGLLMGSAMLAPGRRSVRDALIERGRDSVLLMLGTIPLLVLAGLIEGFVSPLATSPIFQFSFAILPAVFLIWYLKR